MMQMHKQPAARPALNDTMKAAMSLEELRSVTRRLTEMMQQEAALLKAMRIQELPKLQAEKERLTAVLELYQERLASDPGFVKQADAATREDLLLLADDLAFVTQENFRQAASAKAVNARVVQAFMDVMAEQHRPSSYGRSGAASSMADMTISLNLNQRA